MNLKQTVNESLQFNLFDEGQFIVESFLQKKISDERLPTNTTTSGHAIHRWFNFIAGFSPEFVALCCKDQKKNDGGILLDPFAGCGTALVAARQLGLSAIGFEPHPIFCKLATAKSCHPSSWDSIDLIEAALINGFKCPAKLSLLPPSPFAFLNKLIPSEPLTQLLGARAALAQVGLEQDPLSFLVLSKLLDKCSGSQTDGIYKAPTSQKRGAILSTAFRDLLRMIREDIKLCSRQYSKSSAQVIPTSSQNMKDVANNSISVIVTSPPYLNNFDYAEMTRMYLYFWGLANSWGEITDSVRSKLIVNTTTALKGHKNLQKNYRDTLPMSLHGDLDLLVQSLAEKRKTKAGKKEYDLLVYPYFSQMKDVLLECYRVLAPRKKLHMMIADAALYGIHIPTPQIIATLMTKIGFANVNCKLVRKRGHRWILAKREGSPIGLGEYYITANK